MNQLSLSHIGKTYGNYEASKDVSFAIPKGAIFGLLGPNGAGKTTIIRMITQIIYPDSGFIQFNEEKLKPEHNERIGYMPEERGLYKTMKVYEHLIYLARLKGLSSAAAAQRVNFWMEKLQITDWRNKKIEELSKGMAQKIQFIATVVHEPELLILDEPFSGLDPINAKLIETEIFELKQRGCTIIFSTHRMEQVEEICDSIVLINQGRKILEGGVMELKQQFKENKFRIRFDGELPTDFNAQFMPVAVHSGEVIVKTKGEGNDMLRYFIDHQLAVRSFDELLPGLDDIFITAVNQSHG
ncbi:MAG: ATP-binding cassette domain-containing protein [Chitinophagales bacterium]